jgi:hypothetical protein
LLKVLAALNIELKPTSPLLKANADASR